MSIRYKIIAPKYVYYTSCLVYLGSAVLLGYVSIEALRADEVIAWLFLQTISSIIFIWFLFVYLNRFIYAKIDRSSSNFQYGNLFLDNEVRVNEVSFLGKVFFLRKILKIKIDSKRYYMTTIEKGAEHEFEKNA